MWSNTASPAGSESRKTGLLFPFLGALIAATLVGCDTQGASSVKPGTQTPAAQAPAPHKATDLLTNEEKGSLPKKITLKKPDSIQGAALAIAEIDYSMNCQDNAAGARALIEIQGRSVIADLFNHRSSSKVQLGVIGSDPVEARISVQDHPSCEYSVNDFKVTYVSAEIDSKLDFNAHAHELALRHSPYVVLRDDLYDKPHDDVPTDVAYTVEINSGSGTFDIRYTLFFTDENKMGTRAATNGQYTRYGRGTDIEWAYKVSFNLSDYSRTREEPKFQNFFHKESRFDRGSYLPHPEGQETHAIVYNDGSWSPINVFSDKPQGKNQKSSLVGFHLVPEKRIPEPSAREILMFWDPSIFAISEDELAREGKLSLRADEYLYVLVKGHEERFFVLRPAGIRPYVVLFDDPDHEKIESPYSNLDRLGEDMWDEEAYSGIPMTRKYLDQITLDGSKIRGAVKIHKISKDPAIRIRALEFYKLVKTPHGYVPVNLTSQFRCEGEGFDMACFFGQ